MNLPDPKDTHVIVAGATGTIGQAVVKQLCSRGYRVTCLVRDAHSAKQLSDGVSVKTVDYTEQLDAFGPADIVISCLASRTGVEADARAVDYQANMHLLSAAKESGVVQFILLSAICVQKPVLAFQFAKLAFEGELAQAPFNWTIVRPTAFFKSLSGQVHKVMAGKKYLVFGNGEITRCKPISDRDLADFIVAQIGNHKTLNSILPIGGPGPAITPVDQAHHLFNLLEQKPRIKRVPLKMMDMIISMLSLGANLWPKLEEKAEYARIGRYYATESMLCYDADTKSYSAEATPSFGNDTLFEHYENLVNAAVTTSK